MKEKSLYPEGEGVKWQSFVQEQKISDGGEAL